MTKQPKLSKAEAIKEIEKLTGTEFNDFISEFNEDTFAFVKYVYLNGGKREYDEWTLTINKEGISYHYESWKRNNGESWIVPTEWLEPLSILIPILFKEGE